MDNNRNSILAVLGPLVGVALLIIGINFGASYLRQAQEEARDAAEVEAAAAEAEGQTGASETITATQEMTGTESVTAPVAANAGAAVTSTAGVTDVEAVTASDTVTTSDALTTNDTVTATDDVTVTADLDGGESVTATIESTAAAPTGAGQASPGMGMGPGLGRGMGGGATRTFHMTPIPEEYAGMTSPVPADAESIARGEAIFQQNCTVCHGETGMGDGAAAAGLDPAPPSIAMTSQMLGDDYMFWRISEGGAMDPFNSAMPGWKPVLSEDQRWDVINYVRSLGAGLPAGQGGPGMNAELEAQMRAEMLAAGIDQGVITQEQADLFDTVHSQIDALRAADPNRQFTGTMRDLQNLLLEELVASGDVSQEDADEFNTVLTQLEQSGVMQ